MDETYSDDESQEEGSASKEESEEEVAEPTVFQLLQQEFQMTVTELQKKPGMQDFILKYQKLFEEYRKTYESEAALEKENTDLQVLLRGHLTKLEAAERKTEMHEDTIHNLKLQLEKAWKMLDAAHTRELSAKETLESLHQQVTKLSAEMEQKEQLGLTKMDDIGGMAKARDNLLKERERLINEINGLKDQLSKVTGTKETLEKHNAAADIRISELTQNLETQANEAAKQLRLQGKLESQINALTVELKDKETEITHLKVELKNASNIAVKMEAQIKEYKSTLEHQQKDAEILITKVIKFQTDQEALVESLRKLQIDFLNKSAEVKLKDEEITKLKNEAAKFSKMQESYMKKQAQIEVQREEQEKEIAQLKAIISETEHDLEVVKKQADADKKICETLIREREILNKNIMKANGTVLEQEKNIKLLETMKKQLESEIEKLEKEGHKQKGITANIQKERDRSTLEIRDLTCKLEDALEELKLHKMAITDLKKVIAEGEEKYKILQSQLDVVRSERNSFSKLVIEAQDEISDLKQKLKVMTHQIQQLKGDISGKETQLMRQEFALQKSENEKDNLKKEIHRHKEELRYMKNEIVLLMKEEKKLQKIIQETDNAKDKQVKHMKQIMNERDILGKLLFRRNEELYLLNNKIDVLQHTLDRGEVQYEQRLDDVRLLKLEIKRLRHERELLIRDATNTIDLRQEILNLQRDLMREKMKCRALEDELQNPLNIHRWRKLEGADPGKFELIQKVTMLQKRLINQSQEAVNREQKLQEAQQLYLNLCESLTRLPGPDVAMQFYHAQQALKDKNRKMKCMVSELKMYEAQVSQYKYELHCVNNELKEIKKKYLAQKKKHQRQREQELARITSSVPPIINETKVCFAGGGFGFTTLAQKQKTSR